MSEIYKNLDLNNLEGEEWRDIEGYNGKYQVSNYGRVKKIKPSTKIMHPKKDKDGYLIFRISTNKIRKNLKAHRLVATAFIDNPSNLKCVNHKDENKENNCVDNLEWCDDKYNLNYGTCQQRKVANTDYKARTAKIDYKAISTKLTNRQDLSKQVYQYSKNNELIGIYQSVSEAGRNGFHCGSISQCCLGKLKSHRGYIWRYTPL